MARKLVNTKEISHEEWLELRKKSIGGSDAGALMGMSNWKGPVGVYSDKMGLKEEHETSEAMRLGTDLEGYVASRFTEMTGKKVRNDNFMYQHDEYDFITANIDRTVVGENAGLECKTMNSFAAYDFDKGEVPGTYYCQCQHYMMVMGYEKMYLCILVFQRGVFVVTIDRNESFIKELLQTEIDFWLNNIEKRQMPAPSTEEDRESLKEIYPHESDALDELYISSLDQIADEIQKHEESKKFHEEKINQLKARVQAIMGEHGRGYGDEYKVTWLAQERTTVDAKKLKENFPNIYSMYAKTSSSRPLRITKIKKKKEK